jgi:hypothetical protein
MQSNRLTFDKAKQIPIAGYLAGHGIEPVKVYGNDLWYFSPFRSERTPSFKVNTKLNLWYDHGIGEGGSILDLGAKMHQCTVTDFLHKLSEDNAHDFSFHRPAISDSSTANRLEAISAADISSPELVAYLGERHIGIDTGRQYCSEIDFKIGERYYKALGFQNRSGGYELRNNWFKGSSSPKDISLLTAGHRKIAVLEGFMDFLSLVQPTGSVMTEFQINSDFLVLNSLAFINRALPLLMGRSEVNLFLDNDAAAADAKRALQNAGIRAHDRSNFYAGYKDLNEYLVKNAERTLTTKPSTPRLRRLKR